MLYKQIFLIGAFTRLDSILYCSADQKALKQAYTNFQLNASIMFIFYTIIQIFVVFTTNLEYKS